MKKLTLLFTTFLTLIFLSACGQHTSFQGKWKAQKANGEDIDIVFNDKTDMKIATLLEPDYPSSDPLYVEMLYAMNRNEYPDFDDYVDKYLH